MIRYVYVGACAAISLALLYPNWHYMAFAAVLAGICAIDLNLDGEVKAKVSERFPVMMSVNSFVARILPVLLVIASAYLYVSLRSA